MVIGLPGFKPQKPKISHDGSNAVITISNSFCKIDGFRDVDIDLIRKTLTYENSEVLYEIQQTKILIGMAYRYKNLKRVNWLKIKMGQLEDARMTCWLKNDQFPTGHLLIVLTALDDAKSSFVVVDVRVNNATRVEYQRNAAIPPMRYYQKDMVDLGVKNHRGVFVAACGAGKTRIYQELVYALKVPVLLVIPAKDLCGQIYDDFVSFFGNKDVALIDEIKLALKDSTKPIKVCTIHTLTGLLKKDALGTFLKDIGMVIFDEAHHCLTGKTSLKTDQGMKSIREIVINKLDCKVLSYNEGTKQLEFARILDYFEYDAPPELIRITYELNGRPKTLCCTLNHKIFTHNRGYVEAQHLTLEDDVMIEEVFVCKCCNKVWPSANSLSGHEELGNKSGSL